MAVSTIDALYHSGSEKLTTTSDGVNIQGAITSQSPNSGVLLEEYAADAFGANFTMRKSRNATIGGQTAVASGDTLGNITFQGSDGDEFVSGASIQSFVDGTPGNNDMPGNLVFKTTPDGSSTLTERLRITSAGNVGFGTSNPIALLSVVDSSTGSGMELQPEVASNTNRLTNYNRTASAYKNFRLDALQLEFQTSGNERMRVDASGNVLVAQTTTADPGGANIVGTGIASIGYISTSRNGNIAAYFNRKTSNGDIVQFRKDGSTVGSITTNSGGNIHINSQNGTFGIRTINVERYSFDQEQIYPWNNGECNLGISYRRFDVVYAATGSINTSDQTQKQDIASLTATEMLVGKRLSALFKTFRWKNRVAEKGDSARTHTGIMAQDVQTAFTAEGLDASNYALFCSDTWWEHDVDVPAVESVAEVTDEDGNVTTEAVEAVDAYTRTDTYDTEAEAPEGATSKTRMGIRYPELLSFVAAYNEQRFASIEARLTALEA